MTPKLALALGLLALAACSDSGNQQGATPPAQTAPATEQPKTDTGGGQMQATPPATEAPKQ